MDDIGDRARSPRSRYWALMCEHLHGVRHWTDPLEHIPLCRVLRLQRPVRHFPSPCACGFERWKLVPWRKSARICVDLPLFFALLQERSVSNWKITRIPSWLAIGASAVEFDAFYTRVFMASASIIMHKLSNNRVAAEKCLTSRV